MSRDETNDKYIQLINNCDLLIKSGKISEVSNLISKLNLSQVPRPYCHLLAKICRRSGLVGSGLRLLQPIIRSEKIKEDPPNAMEICEYSVLLSRNGSIQEALNLLKEVDAEKNPDAWLYSGYCHISNWDYGKAVEYLEQFLKSSADPYTKLVARVNLISAYLATSQLKEATLLLEETIPLAQQSGAVRLIGNCHELWGQLHFCEGNYTSARQSLKEAQEVFSNNQSFDQLFIFKWNSIMQALESKSVEPLLQFRREAIKRHHWESVRDADLFILKARFDQKTFDHLYFGTPMLIYRNRVQRETAGIPSESYLFGSENGFCFDLQSGRIDGIDFNPGKKIHQTIAALVRDFYAPRNIGTLFAELYPNEFFDINSSPLKIGQLLWRTRQWLHENKLSAEIQQHRGTYRLLIQGDFGIRIPLESPILDSMALDWASLRANFLNKGRFSAKSACLQLDWSRSRFLRVAEWAVQTGQLSKSGQGKATLYQVQSNSQNENPRNVA